MFKEAVGERGEMTRFVKRMDEENINGQGGCVKRWQVGKFQPAGITVVDMRYVQTEDCAVPVRACRMAGKVFQSGARIIHSALSSSITTSQVRTYSEAWLYAMIWSFHRVKSLYSVCKLSVYPENDRDATS